MLDRAFHSRLVALLALVLAAAFWPAAAHADPADIDAAARGVVRVVIIEEQDGEMFPIAHGTGFAVSPERVVTNAHVVADAQNDSSLAIGIVPSDGGKAIYGRLIAYSQRNDLALIATTSPMNLPPLTIAGNTDRDSGGVTAVGYPMNVDRAQGLSIEDIFSAQPPVKSRGFLSGRRPSRDFDTLLHTAPIGKGSSGGPLLDNCGRVIGVNSFGAESGSADAEFYFAVSARELLPFLMANGISAQVNNLPCRSIAELDAQERARAEREQLAAMREQEANRERAARRVSEARRTAEFGIISERDNGMMLSILFVIAAMAAGMAAYELRERDEVGKAKIAAGIGGVALAAALVAWLARPGFTEIDDRVAQILAEEDAETARAPSGVITSPAGEGGRDELVCVVNIERSRITTGNTDDVPLEWTDDGCVNGRTQYGLIDGRWSRVLVPQSQAVVSINRYDPRTREYRVERYLLGHEAMETVREARGKFQAPACGAGENAARELGRNQASITALLPPQPNERIVYNCSPGRAPDPSPDPSPAPSPTP